VAETWWSMPRPIRRRGAGHHRLLIEKGMKGFSTAPKARQARHARLRHRTCVRGLRGAGRERTGHGRRRRRRAGCQGSTTNGWCWRRDRSGIMQAALDVVIPMSTSASSSASRSAVSRSCRASLPTCTSR
jgi:hypothetical protein